MSFRRLGWGGLALAVVWSMPCRAQVDRQGPVDLVQDLLNGQDRMAQGDRSALGADDSVTGRVAAGLEAMSVDTWLSGRHARALIVYTLSGGDPRVLRRATAQVVQAGLSAVLVEGAVAYATGEREAATKLLANVAVRTLPRLLVAPVALAQAATIEEERGGTVLAILDEARLSAPGTLAEEAALRRSVDLLTRDGAVTEAIAMLAKYLWRFGGSIHADAVLSRAVSAIAGHPRISDQIIGVTSSLKRLEPDVRNEMWLAIAQVSVGQGALDLVRHAMTEILGTSDLSQRQSARVQLYSAAVQVVAGKKSIVGSLDQIDSDNLEQADQELLSRVRAVDGQLSRDRTEATKSQKMHQPGSGPTGGTEGKSEARGPTFEKRLATAIENADKALKKDKQ